MMRLSIATVVLAAITSLPVAAETIPHGCYPAVQNWVNGSGYTCPIMGGSAVGSQTPTFIAPPPIEVDCGAATIDILPPVLRNRRMDDVAGGSQAPDPCND